MRTSVLTGGTNNFQTSAEDLNAVATDFINPGVVGTLGNTGGIAPMSGGLAVSPSSGLILSVASGISYVSVTPTGQAAQTVRVKIDAQNVTLASNPGPGTVYNWLYVKTDATLAANPDVNGATVGTLFVSNSTSSSTDNGTPPTYGTPIAVITNAAGTATITSAMITDKRSQAGVNQISGSTIGADGWIASGQTFTYATNNGNKEFTITTSGDQTGKYSPGMKVKVARTTTPPTQAMAFTAASSQYATKASPAGITFTGAFTCEAWIYLNSYSSGAAILSRDTGTTGWSFEVQNGNLVLFWRNGSGGASVFTSLQSIPKGRWVHVAAVATSIATPAANLYLNGALIPNSGSSGATTLSQGTANLAIGSRATAANYFDGYISEARIWSAAQSQANIQGNMGISLVGTETNLVALFQGNGSFNDSTANANNLTATNGAVANSTAVGNPYHSTEYGVITGVSYNGTSTSTLTLTCGNYVIPNQSLGALSYALGRQPYGFPAEATFKLTVIDATMGAKLVNAGVTDHPIESIIYSNTGNAGGSYYVSMYGTEKKIWGFTNSLTQAGNSTTTYTVNLPANFFTALQFVSEQISQATGSVVQNSLIGNVYSTSAIQFYMINSTASAGVGGIVHIQVTGS